MTFSTVSVRVPASTSNCGPGFDTLGLAFDLYNYVTFQRREDERIVYSGDDSRFRERELGMIREVADAFFASTNAERFGFTFNIRGEVPLARGLGSSVTVRAGILGGLNAAAGEPLEPRDMVEIVTRIEGHPDNASAAILGGFCVARFAPNAGCYVDCIRFPVPPELVFVVISPDLEIETEVSRRSLPRELPFGDVVKSLNSLAFITAAFATGDFARLRGAVTDFIHQPYRLRNIPGGEEAIESGIKAGAYTGWLSGSGSSVLCVTRTEEAKSVAAAMEAAFAQRDIAFTTRHLRADNAGLRVEEVSGLPRLESRL